MYDSQEEASVCPIDMVDGVCLVLLEGREDHVRDSQGYNRDRIRNHYLDRLKLINKRSKEALLELVCSS